MLTLLTTIHVLVAVVLILIVLVQSARGADVAAAFGGMGSQAAFGPRGTATLLSKSTTVLAILFMLTSMSLSVLSNRARGGGESILGNQQETQEAAPATAPAPIGIGVEGLPAGVGVQTEIIPAPNPNEAQTDSPARTETTPPEAPSQ